MSSFIDNLARYIVNRAEISRVKKLRRRLKLDPSVILGKKVAISGKRLLIGNHSYINGGNISCRLRICNIPKQLMEGELIDLNLRKRVLSKKILEKLK